MAVGRGRRIDGPAQVEVPHDGRGAQVEHLPNALDDAGPVHRLGAEGLHQQRHRLSHADGIGNLQLAARRRAGGHDVLGHPAGRVRGRAVHFGGVLAREGAAAVAGHAPVGVDNDLAAGQAGVALRSPDHKPARRVDDHLVVVISELFTDDRLDDLLGDVGADHPVAVDAVAVLGRHQHFVEAHRPAALVLEGDLGLGVGPQVRDRSSPAHLGMALGEPVGEMDRQRHQLVGLVAGVAEHHPLVARALLAHAFGDVGRLVVDGDEHRTGVAVEAEQGVVIAGGADGGAHNVGDLHVGLGADLARHHHEARGDQRLASDAAAGIGIEQGVEDGV